MITIEYIQSNLKPGWKLNPNDKIVTGIIRGLNRNDGLCPCQNDSIDKHCPCSNYRENNKCCCNLYVND